MEFDYLADKHWGLSLFLHVVTPGGGAKRLFLSVIHLNETNSSLTLLLLNKSEKLCVQFSFHASLHHS